MPNIKIRSMNGRFSTTGLFLEDGRNFCCPKLLPGQVVEVPEDHPVFSGAAVRHVEVTNEPATRPYQFDSLSQAMAMTMPEDKALESAAMIGTSLELSAQIRQQNKERMEELKKQGKFVPEVPLNFGAEDRKQGMSSPRADNAYTKEGARAENPAPVADEAPPPSGGRSRRGRRGAAGSRQAE